MGRRVVDSGAPRADRSFWWEYARFCFHFYRFGVRLGLRNVRRNGSVLGWKKTLGKIVQPINSPDRFLEHFLVWRYLRDQRPLRVLDVSSPKLLALYAAHFGRGLAEIDATDLVDDYLIEWQVLVQTGSRTPMAALRFGCADARSLPYPDATFDAVYSISVIEHIPDDGDRAALPELVRVTKPGGYILLSVPYDNRFEEQYRDADVYDRKYQGRPLFFQRVYDGAALRRLLDTISGRVTLEAIQIGSERVAWVERFSRLPESLRGLLGPTNLFFALANYRLACPPPAEFDAPVRSQGFAFLALRRHFTALAT